MSPLIQALRKSISTNLWDSIIRDPLNFLSFQSGEMTLEFSRNRIDGYKSGAVKENARPDFLCYTRGALVLRGEEKRSPGELVESRAELLEKWGVWSTIFYGQLPFVLAYATGGSMIKYGLHLQITVASRPGQPSVRRWPSLRAEAHAGLKRPGPAPASNHPDWAAWLRMQDGPVSPVRPSPAQFV